MFSEEGANRRRYEGIVYSAFCRYLQEVTSKSSIKLLSQFPIFFSLTSKQGWIQNLSYILCKKGCPRNLIVFKKKIKKLGEDANDHNSIIYITFKADNNISCLGLSY